MTARIAQVTERPTAVLLARSLETGLEAVILTSPIPLHGSAPVVYLPEWPDEARTGRGLP